VHPDPFTFPVHSKTAFDLESARYAHQYGSHCAWAVCQGYTAQADPQQWKIVDDRRYLNGNSEIREKRELEIAIYISVAGESWPSVAE
jgi:hypothetical protein